MFGCEPKRHFLEIADSFVGRKLRHNLAVLAGLGCLVFEQVDFDLSDLSVQAAIFGVVVGAVAVDYGFEIHQVTIELRTT